MKSVAVVLALLVAVATALPAQARKSTPEIRAFAGALIETGAQHDLFSDAPMFGLEGAMELRPTVHMVASFGWAPTQATYPFVNNNVSIFQYTLGIEAGLARPVYGERTFKPFLSLGAGGRTYAYAEPSVSDKTCTAGYGAAGAELQVAATAVRLEFRDNVYCYESPIAGQSTETRNDIGLAVGVVHHFR
jgi:hypothetical protein